MAESGVVDLAAWQQPGCQCTCGLPGCAGNRRDRAGRPIRHGTANAYDYHECRCVDCVEAHNANVAESRQRINEATRAEARNHRQEWDGADIEVAMRPGLTATEAALILGRTMHAVKRIRKLYRTEGGGRSDG